MLLRDQLWNLTIINNQTQGAPVRMELQVADLATSQPIFSAIASHLELAAGVNVISVQRLPVVSYLLLSPYYDIDFSYNNLLPPGIFRVNYTIKGVVGEGMGNLGTGSFVLESAPLTPPFLLEPYNGAVLDTRHPFFSWAPPAPAGNLLGLDYTIRLVEQNARQSPQEATERNLPLFNIEHISSNSLDYPATMPLLDTGKVYAWQVQAFNGLSYVGASECFSFSLKKDTSKIQRDIPIYLPLTFNEKPQLTNITNRLYFSYNNEDGDKSLRLFIKRSGVTDSDTLKQILVYMPVTGGVNRLSLDLNASKDIRFNELYELYFINARNERWAIQFIRKK